MDDWIDKWINWAWAVVISALAVMICCIALLAVVSVAWLIVIFFQGGGC